MNISEIVKTLGGPTKIGRALGIRPQAVSLWVIHSRIPSDRVLSLIRIAKERGVDLTPEQLRSDLDWAALR
jgi:DNA-binding transcriptional regulator YdaS (Cro superfamily)